MSLLSVDEALRRVLESVERPVEEEMVPLAQCAGRTLARDLVAQRTQPPFAASSMDGYAVRAADAAKVPRELRVIGASAAGRRFAGALRPGEAVRIFTGAPVPEGADAVVIQEDAEAREGLVLLKEAARPGQFVRRAGLDFREGEVLARSGERLDAARLALAAAAGHGTLAVRRKPRVAVLATGDELVPPGEPVGPDQIVASNPFAIAAVVEKAGATAVDLGIAPDTIAALEERIGAAEAARADLLITLGGASVGEHDLVQSALARRGMELGFWRVALRPGKPLLHGRLGPMLLLGLPGNPVSSLVCAILFVVPAVKALLGAPDPAGDMAEPARLGGPLRANDARQDYLRATLAPGADGIAVATAHEKQDSSMLRVFASAQALIVRAPHAPPASAGDSCRIIRLERFC
jgi:molybdopterin molybdotransferase